MASDDAAALTADCSALAPHMTAMAIACKTSVRLSVRTDQRPQRQEQPPCSGLLRQYVLTNGCALLVFSGEAILHPTSIPTSCWPRVVSMASNHCCGAYQPYEHRQHCHSSADRRRIDACDVRLS